MSTINLTVDGTQTGLPAGTNIYMYIVGLVSATTNQYYYLNQSGIPTLMTATDNNDNKAGTFDSGNLDSAAVAILNHNYPNAWADYSVPVSLTDVTTINLGNINTTNCPELGTGTAAFSGRIYFSIGIPKLPFSPTTDTSGNVNGYTAPVTTGFPGSLTLFDWVEFSFDSNSNFNGNTTQVDQFGFELHLNGTPGGSVQGVLNQTRSSIISAINQLAAPFGGDDMQVAVPVGAESAYPANTNFLRVVSPKDIVSPPTYTGALRTYFDEALFIWYGQLRNETIVTQDQSTGYYTGMVPSDGANAGSLVFYEGNYPTVEALKAANPPVAFVNEQITSYDIWQCAYSLASGTPAQKNVQKMIAAGWNRGTLGRSVTDINCSGNAADFYPSTQLRNVWAEQFHLFSKNGLAYGFPYDDVCDQNPTVSLSPAASITITIGKLN